MNIPLDEPSKRPATIIRKTVTQDPNGNPIETNTTIVGTHFVDIQEISPSEQVTAGQIGVEATHKIYPERDVSAGVTLLDHYYVIAGKEYRITWKSDYGDGIVYFKAFEGPFGNA